MNANGSFASKDQVRIRLADPAYNWPEPYFQKNLSQSIPPPSQPKKNYTEPNLEKNNTDPVQQQEKKYPFLVWPKTVLSWKYIWETNDFRYS